MRTGSISLGSPACLAALIFAGAALGTSQAEPLHTIDQQNLGPFTGTSGASAPRSFGQSFTAGLPAVDAFDFLLGGEASVVLRVREGPTGADGLGGTLVGQSAPVAVDRVGHTWFHFDLTDRVTLVPGHSYVAELAVVSGWLGVRLTVDNAYPGGLMLSTGQPPGHASPDYDLVFAEGLHAAPASAAASAPAGGRSGPEGPIASP